MRAASGAAALVAMPSRAVPRETLEEALRPLLDALPLPTLVADPAWNILFASPGATRTLGFTEEELRVLAIDQLIPERLRGRYRALRERARAMEPSEGVFFRGTRIIKTKDGRELPAEIAVSRARILGLDLYVSSFVDVSKSVARDSTERRAAEEMRASLELQLRQAQKMDALGTMAGGIAHDFNNIIGAMMAFTELIKLDLASPAQVDGHMDELRRAGARAKDLVRKILIFARRDAGARRAVRVDSAVRDAIDLLRATIPASIQIDVQISPGSPVVLADLGEIHQVVTNLGTNAARAIGGRPGHITIALEGVTVDRDTAATVSALQPRRYAKIRVEDDGHGMDAETVSRIFEPFFTTKAPGEGSGLGLSVVHGIVRQHEGAILCQSTPGVGTEFEVYLPEIGVDPENAQLGVDPLFRGSGERVLLIDDEAVILRSVSQLLERLGYVVTGHSDPIAALHQFSESPTSFDLVLSDLSMPTMTGVDLGRRIRDIDPKMPVLLMTGFSGTWTPEALKDMGFSDLIAKPLSAAELTSAISKALREAK